MISRGPFQPFCDSVVLTSSALPPKDLKLIEIQSSITPVQITDILKFKAGPLLRDTWHHLYLEPFDVDMPKSTEIVLQFPISHLVFGLFLSPLYSWGKFPSFLKAFWNRLKKKNFFNMSIRHLCILFATSFHLTGFYFILRKRMKPATHLYFTRFHNPSAVWTFSIYAAGHNVKSMHKNQHLAPSVFTPTSSLSKRKLSRALRIYV